MKNEITLYRPDELTEHIEVGLEDETVLILLAKRNKKVTATIYTKSISKKLQLDLDKHNSQYPIVEIKQLNDSHDRFLIIDQKELYPLALH